MDLSIENTGNYQTVILSGEIRAGDSARIEDEVQPLVAEKGAQVAIDLRGVEWLDSTCLTALVNLVTRARLASARAILIGPTPFVSGVFEVTNLNNWFEIVDEPEQAASAFAAQ